MSRLPFLEDQTETFLAAAAVQVQQSSVNDAADKFLVTLEDFELSAPDQSLFDGIQEAANSLFAIRDQADLYGGLLGAKVSQLAGLLQEADETATAIKSPQNHELLDALHELWDATITLGRNLADNPRGPKLYTVPRTMSVADIATALYGSSERANEIMLNNNLTDPFSVPAGTQIIYFS
jgi:hypothetical protein